jgi:hypothetical protein
MTGTGGGSAASGGITFQHRVAAYYATLALVGEQAVDGLPPDESVRQVWLETTDEVDDVKVVGNQSGVLLIQAKRTLDASLASGGELAKVCRQVVRAYREPELDGDARFGIAVGQDTGRPVRLHLATILRRAREQPEGSAKSLLAPTQAEGKVYETFVNHVKREFTAESGRAPTPSELSAILRRTQVLALGVEDRGVEEREALRLLGNYVVATATQASSAWSRLLVVCGELARRRSYTDRAGFQRSLTEAGIALQAPPDIRHDVAALAAHTAGTVRLLRERAAIHVRNRSIKISRSASEQLSRAISQRSLAVVGDAGVGKTGCIADAVEGAFDPVVALAAERLEAPSGIRLRDELQITRTLPDVLSVWPATRGLLIVDGLDAARDDSTRRTLLEVIDEVRRSCPDFAVVVSVRTFDLRNSVRLERILPGTGDGAGGEFERAEFAKTSHFWIPQLSHSELEQLSTEAPEVARILQDAAPALRELAAVPFNLRLLVELLLESPLADDELKRIDSQIGLLEAYWTERVRRPGDKADDREYLLRQVCDAMLSSRLLHADRMGLRGPTNEALVGLLHDHVLVEDVTQGRDTVSFSHNLLFDFAVARLVFRVPPEALVERLISESGLLLSARPSLDLHFRWLWEHDPSREIFWAAALTFESAPGLRAIGRTMAPAVAVDRALSVGDLGGLIESLDGKDGARQAAEGLLTQVVGALLAVPPATLREDGQPWAWLAEQLGQRLRPSLAYPTRALTQHLLSA